MNDSFLLLHYFYISIVNIIYRYLNIQGVPKKTVISVQTVIEGIRNELGIKVGGVSENSGYFLSNEYKNSTISRKKGEKNEVKHGYPPRKNLNFLGTL